MVSTEAEAERNDPLAAFPRRAEQEESQRRPTRLLPRRFAHGGSPLSGHTRTDVCRSPTRATPDLCQIANFVAVSMVHVDG